MSNKFGATEIIKLFKELEKQINELWCFVERCCEKIPINIGSGIGIYRRLKNNKWEFKSLIAGDNVTITETDTEITINSTGGGLDCAEVKECIGVSDAGDPTKFYNEQGDFVTVGGGGFTCNDLNSCDTDNLPEGVTNLYFTNTRAINALAGTPTYVNYYDPTTGLITGDQYFTRLTTGETKIWGDKFGQDGGYLGLNPIGTSYFGTYNAGSLDNYFWHNGSNIGWAWNSAQFTLPQTDGNNGDVMTTNGGGIISFQPIPSAFACSDLVGCNISNLTNDSGYITLTSLSAGTGISYNNLTGVITNSSPDQTVVLTSGTGISVTGTYPNFTITNTSPDTNIITAVSDTNTVNLTITGTTLSADVIYQDTSTINLSDDGSGLKADFASMNISQFTNDSGYTTNTGTVTSVSALTLGTTGTDLSSTVANSTTTPVITLNVPTASASNRGALSSSDWTTFNSKQDNILKASLSSGNVTLNNTLTPTDLTGLSFSVAANSRYAIIGHIRCGSANASGIKWAVNAPVGSTVNSNNFGLTSATTAFRSEIISALATLTTNPFPAANTTQGFLLNLGTVETGANAGTVQIQWATAGNYLITAYKDGTFVFLIKL